MPCTRCRHRTHVRPPIVQSPQTKCNDGDPCTVEDGCQSDRACAATKLVRDDGDANTVDTCDQQVGCGFKAK
ncbi:MAG: hypothetical protein FJ100_19875 [Deltaproteobacteria bacterium]|nr:hypothetical protein [Deltaproteobacteria bacterium]